MARLSHGHRCPGNGEAPHVTHTSLLAELVLGIRFLQDISARDGSSKLDVHQKCSGQLAMETIGLARWWRQPVDLQEGRNGRLQRSEHVISAQHRREDLLHHIGIMDAFDPLV